MLQVFNLAGEKVAELVNEELGPARHSIVWDASDVASGVYVYRLQTEQFMRSRKLTIVR